VTVDPWSLSQRGAEDAPSASAKRRDPAERHEPQLMAGGYAVTAR
jgi:hypothetical protein